MTTSQVYAFVAGLCAVVAMPAVSEAQTALGVEAAGGFRRFEQQVKSEIGGIRGERLVEETELSLNLSGAYRVWKWFSLGAFVRWDIGTRRAGQFEGVDSDGRTIVEGEVGGSFQELWIGPLARFRVDWFQASIGYGAIGARLDDARRDLPAGDDATSALRTSPRVAWLLALDAVIPTKTLFRPMLRLEYRVRYYDRRADAELDDQVVHGTQNFTPLVGVAMQY